MAKLTAAERRAIPKSKFGIPSKAPGPGSYPMNDRTHEIKAKEFATKEERQGKLSPAAANRIRAKADRLLARGK